MSRNAPTRYEELGLREVCRTCGARPGRWCLVKDLVRPAQMLHAARTNLAATRERIRITQERADRERHSPGG